MLLHSERVISQAEEELKVKPHIQSDGVVCQKQHASSLKSTCKFEFKCLMMQHNTVHVLQTQAVHFASQQLTEQTTALNGGDGQYRKILLPFVHQLILLLLSSCQVQIDTRPLLLPTFNHIIYRTSLRTQLCVPSHTIESQSMSTYNAKVLPDIFYVSSPFQPDSIGTRLFPFSLRQSCIHLQIHFMTIAFSSLKTAHLKQH